MIATIRIRSISLAAAAAVLAGSLAVAAAPESFPDLVKRLEREKPTFAKRHEALLNQRYDLSDRRASGVEMAGGKAVQEGVRVKLPKGVTWDQLAGLSPSEIKSRKLWPAGFFPLPHPHHEAGGMVFPQPEIDEMKQQTGRDLTRFDLDFDFPQHLLPEFPAPIFLTTRPDLGDVSKGRLVTLANFHELFDAILNPKQLEGAAVAAHAVPAAAVQRHRGPPLASLPRGRRVPRLPRERPHQRGDPHRG
jgi:cytochrome c peroxidase